MSTNTATNGINPTDTNNEKKPWWITIKLARLLNFLSSTRIIGRIIPKSWSEWAKKVLSLGSHNTATDSEKDQSQNGQETPTPEVEKEKNNELEPEVKVKDEEIQTDDVKIVDQKVVASLESDLNDLRNKLKEMEELSKQLPILAESLQGLKQEREKLEKDVQALKEELTKKEGKIDELRKQLKLLEEEKEVFANYFSVKAQKLEDLQVKNGELKSIIEELSKNYRGLEEAMKEKGEEFLRKLKEKLDKILELDAELIKHVIAFANKTEQFEVEVQEKDAKITNLIALNEVLDKAKQELEAKNNAQQQTISEKDETIRNLQESLQQKDNLIKELMDKGNTDEVVQQENERLKERVTELEEKSRKQLEEINSLQKKSKHVDLLNNKCETLRGENKGLEKSLQQVQTELDQVRREKGELGEQVSSANNEITRLQQELYELTAQLKGMGESKETLQVKLQKEEEKNRGLFTQSNALGLKNSELKSSIKSLRGDLISEKARAQLLQGEKSQHEAQLTDLRNKLEAAEKDKKKLEKQITELQEQVKTLETNRVSVENLKSDHQIRNKSLIDENDELKKLNISLTTEKDKLQAELNCEKAEVGRQKKIMLDRDNKVKMLEESHKISETNLTEAKEELAEQKSKVEQLQSKQKLQPSKEKLSEQTEQSKDPKPQQEQPKALELDTMSMTSVVSTAESNVPYTSKNPLINHIFHGKCKSEHGAFFDFTKSVENAWRGTPFYQAMSELNEQLEKTFPELQGHFCHKVIEETIIFLLDENGGRFKSSKLLELLESNFKNIAKKRIKPKIRGVITEHNELLAECITNAGILEKEKLLPFVKKCVEELKYNIESQFLDTLTEDCLLCFETEKAQKDSNSDRKELLKESVIQVLTDASANGVSNIVKKQKLAPKVGNEFLLLNQDVCAEVKDSVDEYQFNQKLINEIKGTPPTSMIRTNSEHSMSSTKTGRNNTVSRGLGIIGSMFK